MISLFLPVDQACQCALAPPKAAVAGLCCQRTALAEGSRLSAPTLIMARTGSARRHLGHSSAIAAGRLGPVSWSRHDRTEHGWGHRAMRSRTTWRHTSQPVSGIGMPKLWAYTSSRGTAVASTS